MAQASRGFKFERALSIARKEVYHVLRDPFTLILALVLPFALVTLFGFVIEFNMQDIDIAVVDRDKTQSTRQFIDAMQSSNYFRVHPVEDQLRAISSVDGDQNRAALIIEPEFEKRVLSGQTGNVQVLLDGADNSTVGPVVGYLSTIQGLAQTRITEMTQPTIVQLKTRFLYNSELNSKWFIVPGLTVFIMALLSILLTALTVAREWEHGSMELLLSTPVQPMEIILGKLLPYMILGLLAVGFVYVAAPAQVGAVDFRSREKAANSDAVIDDDWAIALHAAFGVCISHR